jgi:hypothetical protein
MIAIIDNAIIKIIIIGIADIMCKASFCGVKININNNADVK